MSTDIHVPINAPKPHPLAVALADGWRWLRDDARQTTVILHRSSGLWVEVFDEVLPKITDAQAEAIAGALRIAAIEGKHGEVTVLVTKQEDGSIRASIGRVSDV